MRRLAPAPRWRHGRFGVREALRAAHVQGRLARALHVDRRAEPVDHDGEEEPAAKVGAIGGGKPDRVTSALVEEWS